MQLKKLVLLPLAACTVFSTATLAEQITFRGTVSGTTCIPDVGGGSPDGIVDLDPVMQSMFSSQGNTAGPKSFNINLTGCNDPTGKVIKAYFWQPTANTEGRLVPTFTDGGSGWTYQLLNAAGSPLVVGTTGSSLNFSDDDPGAAVTPGPGGTGQLTYQVRYYNETGSLTNGKGEAVATYVLYTN